MVQEKDEVYMQLIAKLSAVIDKYSYLEGFAASEAWYEHLLSVDAYKAGKPENDADVEQVFFGTLR